MLVILHTDTMIFARAHEESHPYHPWPTELWERALLNTEAPNQYDPKLDVTAAADGTLYIALAQGLSQDDTIDALHDEIAASEALIGGSRDEARRHELRVTLRGFMAQGDDCWSAELRAELIQADRALRHLPPIIPEEWKHLPADTAAQYDARQRCRRILAQELRAMDLMWLRFAGVVPAGQGMLAAGCTAELELRDTEGSWQHDGNTGLAQLQHKSSTSPAQVQPLGGRT